MKSLNHTMKIIFIRVKQHDYIRHNKSIYWGYCRLNLILWAFNSVITIRYIIKHIKRVEMIINKNKEGAIKISDIINGYWVTKIYYFYTRKNAIKLFKQEYYK
jgi:hypothetical protein